MRLVLAASVLAAALMASPAPTFANGRYPASTRVAVGKSDGDPILLGVTFGLLLSTDGGATFHWVCETAIGYAGTFDPKYAVGPNGTLYATTFEGLRRSTDSGCTWNLVTLGDLGQTPWVDEIAIGSDDSVWVTTATTAKPNDVFVLRSGETDFVSAGLNTATGWWKSIQVAPSKPARVYVTGYDVAAARAAGAVVHLRRTDDGGAHWDDLATTDFTFGDEPQLYVDAVSPTNPDIVYARVTGTGNPVGDTLYRSTDGGDSWTAVVSTNDPITGVVVRQDGSVLVATVNDGLRTSPTGAADTFTPIADPPRLSCLENAPNGDLYGCATNWLPDNMALGVSKTGTTWTPIMRFQDIAGPLECPADTIQTDTCVAEQWPGVCTQLGVCGAPSGDDLPPPDAAPTGPVHPKPTDGCGCRAGLGAHAAISGGLLALLTLGLTYRRRRRKGRS